MTSSLARNRRLGQCHFQQLWVSNPSFHQRCSPRRTSLWNWPPLQEVSANFSSSDAGDFTPFGIPATVSMPADLPFATGVGGVSLALNPDSSLAWQAGWGNNITGIVAPPLSRRLRFRSTFEFRFQWRFRRWSKRFLPQTKIPSQSARWKTPGTRHCLAGGPVYRSGSRSL